MNIVYENNHKEIEFYNINYCELFQHEGKVYARIYDFPNCNSICLNNYQLCKIPNDLHVIPLEGTLTVRYKE